MTTLLSPAPLEGMLVVETGARIAVGACGSLLAQLGATVVVLEPHERHEDGKWAHRARMMAGKLSLAVDRNVENDRRLASDLLDRADVVLQSPDMSDGAWHIHASRTARQIVVDLTTFGSTGPCARLAGDEAAAQAFCGIVDTTGALDGPPVVVGVPVLEMSAAIYAAASVLLARRVVRQQCGQCIDISLVDVGISFLANFLALSFGGYPATRSGNRHPLYMPWGCYRARGGHLLLCTVSNEQFARLANAIGKPWLAADPRFATPAGRLRGFRELDAELIDWASQQSLDVCERALADAGIACGRIVAMEDIDREPNLVHRCAQRTIIDPCTGGEIGLVVSPLLDRTAREGFVMRAPAPDADRDTVLALLDHRRAVEAKLAEPRGADAPPLAGIRIVEIGHYTVAPFATRLLGAFGADVIKVEPPQGEAVRYGPPLRADGMSYIFALSNTDKRGLVLDLTKAGDRDMLDRLLAQSHVLIENLRPGALERLGFGPAVLRARHPHLVYCAITGFGRDSVYPNRPALDSVIQAMSGLMSETRADGEPMKAGISAADSIGGLFGMLAMLAGLEQRERHGGPGRHFDLSMQDASAWVTQMTLGPGHPEASRVLQANDGYVVVSARQADTLNDLDASAMTRHQLVAHLQARGLRAASVQTVAEVLAHPQTAARDMLVECECPGRTPWTVLNAPMRLQGSRPVVRRTLGALGTDHAAIVAELGLAAAATAIISLTDPATISLTDAASSS